MAKKNNKNKNNNYNNASVGGGDSNNNALEENQNQNGNHQKDGGVACSQEKTKSIPVLLKIDLHCDGCATKIVKCIRSFEGVEGVKCESGSNKLTVVGNIDPLKLKEKVVKKTHKKVEVISPLPKKENKENSKANGEINNNKPKDKKKEEKEKQAKELPVTTAVMKVHLHCDGCVNKIYKVVSKTHGYQEMKVDKQKDLITVTGAMDMKALSENVKKHMKKDVEIVPPKKDGEKGKGDKKGGGGGLAGKDKNGGGGKDKNGGSSGNGGGEKAANGGDGNQTQMHHVQYGYPYNPNFFYGSGWRGDYAADEQFQSQNPYEIYHAPQMFSDENPNACVVM